MLAVIGKALLGLVIFLFLKFINSEKAAKFEDIVLLVLTLLKRRFLQIFVAFSETLNFIRKEFKEQMHDD